MNVEEVIARVEQVLEEERIFPTTEYRLASPAVNASAGAAVALGERRGHRFTIYEHPENFILRIANFDILCALADRVPERDRSAILAASLLRISNKLGYRDTLREVLGAGQWQRCSSELPLVAEFNVRRGNAQSFIAALSAAAVGPGLTLLLVHLGEMIALNYTLFTEEEYSQDWKSRRGHQA